MAGELEAKQAELRALYVRAKAAGERFWQADADIKGFYGVPSDEGSQEFAQADSEYEAAQREFKQALHALIDLTEEEVDSVYNPGN